MGAPADRRPAAAALLARWGCEAEGEPFATGASLLWPARRGAEPVMLKLADPEDDEAEAAAVLAALDGRGAVRLLARDGAAALMERAPGPDLIGMALDGRDDAAMAILTRVVRTMHAALGGLAIPTLIPWDRRADALRASLRDGSAPPALRPGFERAAALLDRLVPATRGAWRALHGDVHHGNVLGSPRGWLAIDPKGILGPPAYDWANLLTNPLEIGPPPPVLLDRRLGAIERVGGPARAELLPLAWVHVQMAMAWDLGRADWQARGLACAAALEGVGAP